MQKIVPHLWFDAQAVEAAAFYTTIFPDSKVTSTRVIKDTPSGDCDVVAFELMGMEFQSISAGPYFKFNPSVSFMVNFDPSQDANAAALIDEVWEKLSEGGKVLMPIDAYPFSKRYGWIEDKYGLSWQLILTDPEGEERPRIIPALLFTEGAYGKAEEAVDFYASVFKDSKKGTLAYYPAGMPGEKEGTVMFADVKLDGVWIAAMDSAHEHGFTFNEAVSLIVRCENQEEIDYFSDKLSAVPEAEQCGWLKDAYGVSWQVTPYAMEQMMTQGTPEQMARVTQAFLPMKRFDIAVIEAAYKGE
jgi:predicted 3-demethylubiquinone-9 3-methyltransferase (glyoxalase superfamily)